MDLAQRLSRYSKQMPDRADPVTEGQLTRLIGLTIEAVGCDVAMGGHCLIENDQGDPIEAEVVGFDSGKFYLMPTTRVEGLRPGARIQTLEKVRQVAVGFGLLGRVLDGAGNPIDGRGPLQTDAEISLRGTPINPLDRKPIAESLDVGIRSINSLLTVGRGQRLGLFAGSGVGKSVLLGMMSRFTEADVSVVALVGERGREVKEFVEQSLGPQGLARTVVIASPADDSPLMRLRSAMLATSIAEYFRDQGKDVLLLMDSLTRFAQAQRELALAVGEPPATKGYPPSVFAKMPQLVERAGNSATGVGSITGLYTVLTEGDDMQDPVADAARAILDGHIVLSRSLAEAGHYPAVDVEASISRVMPQVIPQQLLAVAQRFKQLYARYQQSADLIRIGAYTPGADPETDFAIERMPLMQQFLQQGLGESVNFEQSYQQLIQLIDPRSAADIGNSGTQETPEGGEIA